MKTFSLQVQVSEDKLSHVKKQAKKVTISYHVFFRILFM